MKKSCCSTQKSFISGQNVIFNNENVLSNLKICYPIIQNRAILLASMLSIAKRGIQHTNMLFNMKTCYSVKTHVINSENAEKKCKSTLKGVIQHENTLNNMLFALDNMLFVLDNKFVVLDNMFVVLDSMFVALDSTFYVPYNMYFCVG